MCKSLKKFLQQIQSYEDVPFLGPKWSISLSLFFFFFFFFFFFLKKLLISFSSTYWPLLLCKIPNKFFQPIQSYEDVPFLGPKWPTCQNENFFRKPVNRPCSFHLCLSKCQKSKSDINLLIKY